MTSGRPFSADTYVVSRQRSSFPLVKGKPSIALYPMSAETGRALGEAFAAMEPWSRYPFSSVSLTKYLTAIEPQAPRFVIEVDGEIAGAIGVRAELLRGPYLQFLGMLPKLQGRGIGSAILDWMEAEAGPYARNLWVCASDTNTAAIRFYERHGFRRVALLDGLVQDGLDEVLLRKRLK